MSAKHENEMSNSLLSPLWVLLICRVKNEMCVCESQAEIVQSKLEAHQLWHLHRLFTPFVCPLIHSLTLTHSYLSILASFCKDCIFSEWKKKEELSRSQRWRRRGKEFESSAASSLCSRCCFVGFTHRHKHTPKLKGAQRNERMSFNCNGETERRKREFRGRQNGRGGMRSKLRMSHGTDTQYVHTTHNTMEVWRLMVQGCVWIDYWPKIESQAHIHSKNQGLCERSREEANANELVKSFFSPFFAPR